MILVLENKGEITVIKIIKELQRIIFPGGGGPNLENTGFRLENDMGNIPSAEHSINKRNAWCK